MYLYPNPLSAAALLSQTLSLCRSFQIVLYLEVIFTGVLVLKASDADTLVKSIS
jgi:hypothetical protein